MQLNSYIFILALLPVTVVSYFLLNRIRPIYGKYLLALASAAFYAYGGWKTTAVLGVSLTVNYGFSLWLATAHKEKKGILILDLVINVGLLLYFKYTGFLITELNRLFASSIPMKEILLPLGISFFTFQQIMYVVNVYKGELKPELLDYLLYILYFPKLMMGPLCEPKPFLAELNDAGRKQVDWDNIACGIKVFSFGLFKKLVLADTFAKAAGFAMGRWETATSMELILMMLFYTFEIYFDFSGYSNMALGVSAMLNLTLPMNFDSPYQALSIRDFWKRWHMSLTGFFTRYVYFPLGGSRKGTVRTCINTILVFLISGLWHGANMTFLLWGLLNGLLSVAERFTEKSRNQLHPAVQWGVTFALINVLWLLFFSESCQVWLQILGRIFTFQSMEVRFELYNCFNLPETNLLVNLLHIDHVAWAVNGFQMLVYTLFGYFLCMVPQNNDRTLKKNNGFLLLLAIVAYMWAFFCVSGESVFVYFNF